LEEKDPFSNFPSGKYRNFARPKESSRQKAKHCEFVWEISGLTSPVVPKVKTVHQER
jgi:hypothetical protein